MDGFALDLSVGGRRVFVRDRSLTASGRHSGTHIAAGQMPVGMRPTWWSNSNSSGEQGHTQSRRHDEVARRQVLEGAWGRKCKRMESTARNSTSLSSKLGRLSIRNCQCGWCADDGGKATGVAPLRLPLCGMEGGPPSRHWTRTEFRQVKSMQVRTTRRVLGMWPKQGGDWPTSAQRTARWAESLWKEAKIPLGTKRSPAFGHGGGGQDIWPRVESHPGGRVCVMVAKWRGAWWRRTVEGLLQRRTELGRRRLDTGHRCLGTHRWGDPSQRHVDASIAVDADWRDVAQDRDWWHRMEPGFVARIRRKTPKLCLPHNRSLMGEARCPWIEFAAGGFVVFWELRRVELRWSQATPRHAPLISAHSFCGPLCARGQQNDWCMNSHTNQSSSLP